MVIRDVVDDADVTVWKEDLQKYVKENPVEGEFQYYMGYNMALQRSTPIQDSLKRISSSSSSSQYYI